MEKEADLDKVVLNSNGQYGRHSGIDNCVETAEQNGIFDESIDEIDIDTIDTANESEMNPPIVLPLTVRLCSGNTSLGTCGGSAASANIGASNEYIASSPIKRQRQRHQQHVTWIVENEDCEPNDPNGTMYRRSTSISIDKFLPIPRKVRNGDFTIKLERERKVCIPLFQYLMLKSIFLSSLSCTLSLSLSHTHTHSPSPSLCACIMYARVCFHFPRSARK